jgi:ATP-dependent DNA helicase DinG
VAKLCERAGKGWFREVSLPRAQVALRQGAGRLMRRPDDRGVVALLDPRIHARGWGKSVLKAMPPAPVTGSLEDVRRFFAADGDA